MKRILVCAGAKTLLAAAPAQADFLSGNDLHEWCERNDRSCIAYVLGAFDGMRMATDFMWFCIPGDMRAGQMKDVVSAYLQDHPEDRHQFAPVLIARAVAEAWPCDD